MVCASVGLRKVNASKAISSHLIYISFVSFSYMELRVQFGVASVVVCSLFIDSYPSSHTVPAVLRAYFTSHGF